MYFRCSECGCLHEEDEFYSFFSGDDDTSIGCDDCVEERKRTNEWLCPHCAGEIDQYMKVYYKDGVLVGCSECVCHTAGRTLWWDQDENEDYK